MPGQRIALVHEWLTTLGGSERVLLELHRMFPDAPVFVSLYDPRGLPEPLRGLRAQTTWLQRIPGAARRHRMLLSLMPLAFASLDLRGFQVVISSSHACAKGVRVPRGTVHVCYCHTPMRYAWDLTEEYVRVLPAVARPAARITLAWLRRWDRESAQRVDHFIANSQFVADRISRHYGRDAAVIYPPVETEFFTPAGGPGTAAADPGPSSAGGVFLVASRLVPYKRIDLAVEAFNRLGLPLVVAGDGPERRRLEAMARANVRFLGTVSDEALRQLYRGCTALVFPGVEDFGIVPVEAQACGRPVIAFGEGGTLETVRPEQTGVFFRVQSAEALADAVRSFDPARFDPGEIRAHAEQFSRARFQRAIMDFVTAVTGQRT